MKFLKEHWPVFFGLLIIGTLFYLFIIGMNNPVVQAWGDKPIQNMQLEDLLIIVVIHAFINRTEIKK